MATDTDNDHEPEGNFELSQTEKDIRDKILHLLKIYRYLSPSMIQVGIGPSLPPTLWKPLLDQLVQDKVVFKHSIQAETPKGRIQMYTVITLDPQLPHLRAA